MSLELEVGTRAHRDIRAIVLYIAKQNGDFIVSVNASWIVVKACCARHARGRPIAHDPGIRKFNAGTV